MKIAGKVYMPRPNVEHRIAIPMNETKAETR